MLSIIIPVFNEEKTISLILDSAEKAFSDTEHEIIVVNDGSTDATQKICLNYKNIRYIHLSENMGKGFALRTAFARAYGSFIAIQDADLEYNPAVLRKLYNCAKDGIAIYGKRDRKHGYLMNRFGNTLLSGICNLLYGSNLFDIYTGYKIIPAKILQSFPLTSDGFEIEAEITAKLLRAKIPIVEIPITYSPRSLGEGKHIRARDEVIGLWTLIKNRF